MPQFRKNNKPLHLASRRRRRIVAKATAIPNQKILVESSFPGVNDTPERSRPYSSGAPEIEELPSGTLKPKLTANTQKEGGRDESIDEFKPESEAIERMIDNLALSLNQPNDEELSVAYVDPEAFDGVSNKKEQLELLEEELKASHKQSHKLEHEINLLKAEFDAEKKSLEKNISELRRELHRTAPIDDNKFFSLSRELREAIAAIEDLNQPVEEVEVDLNSINTQQSETQTIEKDDVATPLSQNTKDIVPVKKMVKKYEDKNTPTQKEELDNSMTLPKNSGKSGKRLLVTGTVVSVIVGVLITYGYTHYFREAEVDEALVAEYLENGNVAGAVSDDTVPQEGVTTAPTPQAITMIDNSQKEVTLGETIWDTFLDEDFGIRLQYPVNAVKLNKTDSSVTFQRKSGYIFKVQRIDTALELDEYWKQVSANNLAHEVTETKLDNYDALLLELTEDTEYPGNRYLIKKGDKILDVWFATPSNRFDADDIARADKMLQSLTIL